MKTYRAEILGRIPNGLTANDVYASVWQIVSESTTVESSSKRSLSGNHVSVIVTYQANNDNEAKAVISRASTGVYNFSADIIGPREVK